jgi:copper chaperone CopZ
MISMKKAIIEGMCCTGCAKAVKSALSAIYGVTHVEVSFKDGTALFDGFVAKEVIAAAIEAEGYKLIDIVKV